MRTLLTWPLRSWNSLPALLLACAIWAPSPAAAQVYYNFTNSDLTIGGTTYDSYALDNTYAAITSNTTNVGGVEVLFATNEAGIGNLQAAIDSSTGSGAFTRMYEISNPGNASTQRGYNSSVGSNPSVPSQNNPQPRYDQGGGNVSDPIAVPNNITTVNIGGTLYFEFMIDGGESDNRSALSIDQFMIFTADTNININDSTANPTPKQVYDLFKAQSSAANLIYSLDEFNLTSGTISTNRALLLNLVEAGNGDPDFAFYVPVSSIITGPNDPARFTRQIYIWTEMGATGTLNTVQWGNVNFDASGTFEEVAYFKGGQPYSAVVPEPEVYVTGLLLLGLAGFKEWRRRQLRR